MQGADLPEYRDRRTGVRRVGEELSNGQALLAAVELHDPETAQHSRNTLLLAEAVALRLGLSDLARTEVKLVAMLHDVGKLGMPERILVKAGALSSAERAIMEEHPAAGAQVVSQIPELSHLAPAIRAGHERWDGRGYPDGLAGEEIPLPSRIATVCDAYDAMTSDRPYRSAISHESAVRELRINAGSQFCARCLAALLEVIAPEEAGLASRSID